MKQQKAHRQLWIKELRETTKKQGKFALHNILEDSYCCLGIACEVAIANGVAVKKTDAGNSTEYDSRTGGLPESVRQWLGLDIDTGHFEKSLEIGDQLIGSLVSLNDNTDWTFKQIADLIESEPEGLCQTA